MTPFPSEVKMNKHGQFGIKPIKFTRTEYKGADGSNALNIDYSLSKLITQNILYIAYRQPISIPEIAKQLSAPRNVVEEEIEFIEKNGFMINTSADNYLTNMLLHDYTLEVEEELHKIYTRAAMEICDKYVPSLFAVPSIVPIDNDFYMWSLITFACSRKCFIPDLNQQLEPFYVKRKDGSKNLAYATVLKDYKYSYRHDLYRCYGDKDFTIAPEIFPFRVWQFNSYYSDRADGKIASSFAGFPDLYDFIHNRLENDPDKEERMERIIRNGLVTNNEINIIVIKKSLKDFTDLLPAMSDELVELNHELDRQVYELCKTQYPLQMQDLFSVFCKNTLNTGGVKTRILEMLLQKGVLKPLTEHQKKTVNMIMFLE